MIHSQQVVLGLENKKETPKSKKTLALSSGNSIPLKTRQDKDKPPHPIYARVPMNTQESNSKKNTPVKMRC